MRKAELEAQLKTHQKLIVEAKRYADRSQKELFVEIFEWLATYPEILECDDPVAAYWAWKEDDEPEECPCCGRSCDC